MNQSKKAIKRQLTLKEPVKLRYRKLKDGNKSLYLDIYWKGVRTYDFLFLYLVPEIDEFAQRQNQIILEKAIKSKAQKTLHLLKGHEQMDYSKKETRKREPRKKTGLRLLDFVQRYAEERKKPGQTINQGRCGSVLTIKRHLEKFGAKNKMLEDVDTEFCMKFIDYLKNAKDLHTNMQRERKLSDSTIYLKYCILKSILKEAEKMKLIKENPMDYLPSSYHIKCPDNTKCYLEKNELEMLRKASCPIPQLKEAFLFSCLTGLRKSDIEELTWEQITRHDGKYQLTKKIKKTQKWLTIPLSAQACQYLPPHTKYSTGLVFTSLNSSTLSTQIKEWARNSGIRNKKVTFHTARHTFATLELTLGVDLYTVSQLLGHKNVTTTQTYAKVVSKQKEHAVSLIDDCFKVTGE